MLILISFFFLYLAQQWVCSVLAGYHWTADTDSDPLSDGLWVSGSAPVFVKLSGDFSAG